MTLDQEHFARVAPDRPVEAVGDHLQPRRLVWRNIPGPGDEVDGVEVDARHHQPYRRAVADFIEREAPVDPVHRWSFQRVVDHLGRGDGRFDDVTVVRNPDHRRRQFDIEAADRGSIAEAVIDDDDLAAVAIAANPAQQMSVRAGDGDDLRAIGPEHDGAVFAADLLGADIARAVAEALVLVVADEGLTARIDHDHTAGLGEDLAAALIAFLALAAEV